MIWFVRWAASPQVRAKVHEADEGTGLQGQERVWGPPHRARAAVGPAAAPQPAAGPAVPEEPVSRPGRCPLSGPGGGQP